MHRVDLHNADRPTRHDDAANRLFPTQMDDLSVGFEFRLVRYKPIAANVLENMALDAITDAELIARARAGDAEAFCGIYDRYAEPLARWFARLVGDAHAADLAAETIASAWRARSRFRDQHAGSAGPWLFGIARNVLRDSLRKGRREEHARRRLGLPRDLAIDAGFEATESRLSPSLELAAAIAGLGSGEREALELRVIDELGYREIAQRLEIHEAAARLRVSRALRRLRLALSGGTRS